MTASAIMAKRAMANRTVHTQNLKQTQMKTRIIKVISNPSSLKNYHRQWTSCSLRCVSLFQPMTDHQNLVVLMGWLYCPHWPTF